ncbi:MAG: bifunctional indole-3-glycerol-phosphate synthase TrpC/phosphoribosylanthranilate isomerase TrpF [Candidatus Berkiellales bacterium]
MLKEMIEKQKQDLLLRQKMLPLPSFLPLLQPSTRDFIGALKIHQPALIFECKYRSPSLGKLRSEYPITEMAKQYAKFADAISVLTNTPFFGGSFSHLRRVSQAIDKPILAKDIIIDPYQVAVARLYGADAVLLMLSVLDDREYLACREQAEKLNMSVLTEVHTRQELLRAKQLNANLIGINHRNLNTLELDMGLINKLLTDLPKDTLIIAESGIHSAEDMQKLSGMVDGFLIGTTLSRATNIDHKMRELAFGNVKICGLTREEDVKNAFLAGATFGGLNFIPESLRKITVEQAIKLQLAAPMKYVGIFAKQAINTIVETAKQLNLHAVQMHGQEDNQTMMQLRQALPPSCQIWLAVPGNTKMTELPPGVDKLVFDTQSDRQFGGTGQTFDWAPLTHSPLLKDIVLAGGLASHNIAAASKIKAWALDISSSVECKPGVKDPIKLKALFQNLRGACYDTTS